MRALILAGVVIAAACKPTKHDAPKKTAVIVVTSRDLQAGAEVSMLDVARAAVPAECATPSTLDAEKTMKSVVGQVLVHSLAKGEPVRTQDVTRDLACHHGPMMPVVAAKKPIKRGEVLTEENVHERVIPEEHATESVFRTVIDPDDPKLAEKIDLWKKRVLGKKLKSAGLRAGDILRVSDID